MIPKNGGFIDSSDASIQDKSSDGLNSYDTKLLEIFDEFKKSAISTEVIDCNIKFIDGYEGFTFFLNNSEFKSGDRRGDGRLTKAILEKYDHLYNGYWFATHDNITQVKPLKPRHNLESDKVLESPTDTVFGKTGYITFSGGKARIIKFLASQLKIWPKLPRNSKGIIDHDAIAMMSPSEIYRFFYQNNCLNKLDLKCIKYESLPGQNPSFFFPDIPLEILEKVAKDNFLELPKEVITYEEKWNWIRNNPKIPIVITEGTKKALSLISAGKIAIAAPSITLHSEAKKEGEFAWITKLKPELLWLLNNDKKSLNCPIYIAFDCDQKEKARRNTIHQISILGDKLNEYCEQIFVMQWNDQECKGVDDFLFKYGNKKEFENLFYTAVHFLKFKEDLLLSKNVATWQKMTGFTPDKKINSRFISEDLKSINFDDKILAIKSEMGSGKTYWLKEFLSKINNKSLILGDRIFLTRQLSKLTEGCFVNEIEPSELLYLLNTEKNFSVVIDSLLKLTDFDWENITLIINEAEQVTKSLILGGTEIKNRRSDVLKLLYERILSVSNIILMDAHLSDETVNFWQFFSKKEVVKVENTFRFEGRKINIFEDRKEFLDTFEDARFKDEDEIEKNNRFLVSDSAKNLEALNVFELSGGHDKSLIFTKNQLADNPDRHEFLKDRGLSSN